MLSGDRDRDREREKYLHILICTRQAKPSRATARGARREWHHLQIPAGSALHEHNHTQSRPHLSSHCLTYLPSCLRTIFLFPFPWFIPNLFCHFSNLPIFLCPFFASYFLCSSSVIYLTSCSLFLIFTLCSFLVLIPQHSFFYCTFVIAYILLPYFLVPCFLNLFLFRIHKLNT
jgi:hypothetical protein